MCTLSVLLMLWGCVLVLMVEGSWVFCRERWAGETVSSDGRWQSGPGLQGERLQHLCQRQDLVKSLCPRHPPSKVSHVFVVWVLWKNTTNNEFSFFKLQRNHVAKCRNKRWLQALLVTYRQADLESSETMGVTCYCNLR